MQTQWASVMFGHDTEAQLNKGSKYFKLPTTIPHVLPRPPGSHSSAAERVKSDLQLATVCIDNSSCA